MSLDAIDSEHHVTVNCDLCGEPPGEPFLSKHGLWYTRCHQCGFVFANPRARDFKEYNEENKGHLMDKYVLKHFGPKSKQAYSSRVRPFSSYRQKNRILEIGCSVGGFLFQAKAMGWEAVGVEPVESVAEFGRRQYGLDIRACILEEAGFEADSFDVVFSNAVLEHLPSPKSVIREATRILRPGGVFYGDTVNLDSYTWKAIGDQWRLIDPRAHLSLFTPKTLRRFCEDCGLEIVRMHSRGFRSRPDGGERLTGLAKVVDQIKKGPSSFMARITLKGDRIGVLARKPQNIKFE